MIRKPLFSIFLLASIYASAQVSVTEIKVMRNDSLIDLQKPIQLSYQHNQISFKFDDKTDSLPVFRYNLQNIDLATLKKKWINAKENRNIIYSDLLGGKYIFEIKNLHNNTQTSISFEIELLFWQNWWFIPLMFFYALIILGVIIYLILLYRFRQQTKLQRVRDNIASDLHDDVGATLSSISFFGEMMRSKINKNAPKEEVLPLLDKLITTSKETVETMRGVVWTINPNNDNAVDFFGKLQSFGKEILSAKSIEFSFESSGFENQKLPLEVQRNLFLFYKEAINNTAKHSKASKVGVDLRFTNDDLRINIYDDGTGFNPQDLHEGHGLKSLKKRAVELEGTLTIDSAIGKGTKINLEFPLN